MKFAKYLTILIAVIVAAAILLILVQHVKNTKDTVASDTPAGIAINAHLPMETITLGQAKLQVEVASDEAQRQQGLSGRTSLEEGHGMLFVFYPPRAVSFWMKDMHFSLDMVFANKDGVIIRIDTNVSPDTYPKLFSSGVPIMYVVEIPAGYVASHGIALGQKIVVQ